MADLASNFDKAQAASRAKKPMQEERYQLSPMDMRRVRDEHAGLATSDDSYNDSAEKLIK